VSGRIGYVHGCERLSHSTSSVRVFGFDASGLSEQEFEAFTSADLSGQLTEIWAGDDLIYVAEKIMDCSNDVRTTFRLPRDSFKFHLTSKLP
jgi:hypothetical protein